MKHRTADIPGLRQPTQQERAWIEQIWGPEVSRVIWPKAGKVLRYIGVFFICTGGANLFRGLEGLGGMAFLLVLGLICIMWGNVSRNSKKRAKRREGALCRGEYYVANAQGVKVTQRSIITDGYYDTFQIYRVNVILPNGQKISPEIPAACAQPLLKKGIQQVPVLLIQIPGDPDLLAIPCEGE